MSVLDEFEGHTPAQVAEKTLLFSETELKRMCARGEIQHHRGGRNRIVFYEDDVRALVRQFRRTPITKSTETPALAESTVSLFKTTARSKAAHHETDRRSA